MNRTRTLDRRHRRIFGLGIVASVAFHAAVFASLRFSVPSLDRHDTASLSLVAPTEPVGIWEEATRVVETAPDIAALEALAPEAGGEPGAGGAPPPPRAAAPLGGIAAPITAAGNFAFQPLAVVDPLTNGRISPISFGDLPEAEFTVALDSDEEDIPIYVPGSIGQAKRNWAKGSGAGNGEGGLGDAIRIGIGGTGGGHCPMPGKGGRPLPPVWKIEPFVAS